MGLQVKVDDGVFTATCTDCWYNFTTYSAPKGNSISFTCGCGKVHFVFNNPEATTSTTISEAFNYFGQEEARVKLRGGYYSSIFGHFYLDSEGQFRAANNINDSSDTNVVLFVSEQLEMFRHTYPEVFAIDILEENCPVDIDLVDLLNKLDSKDTFYYIPFKVKDSWTD